MSEGIRKYAIMDRLDMQQQLQALRDEVARLRGIMEEAASAGWRGGRDVERTDELKERIRQQPLNDRLEESRRRIGDMCSQGRCPKMTIPVQHDDDDFYINTTLADAQATIAALQAQLNEQSEKLKYHDLFKQWQCWRDPDELVDEYEKWQAAIQEHQALKDQLTQRTVERDTARRRVDELEAREVDVVTLREDLEQRTAEIEAANKLLYKKNCALGRAETIINDLQAELEAAQQQLSAAQETILRTYTASAAMDLVGVRAELERVRGELMETKEEVKCLDEQVSALNQGCLEYEKLLLALPKVEGEINQRLVSAMYGRADGTKIYFGPGVAAILQHRQGMEG